MDSSIDLYAQSIGERPSRTGARVKAYILSLNYDLYQFKLRLSVAVNSKTVNPFSQFLKFSAILR